ncbi:hypothetical protein RHMOL_Rhmol12G0136000 [Rhododendron molle]|uniref:Uncharacterized protein n=1 Tax=Rhododendron molle TaxID=49168 RepID=A0ACC0LIW7_RHOML|nr:hypothetical protein RHMOL_Rhmol12G0136000 [Rhododendron molle]
MNAPPLTYTNTPPRPPPPPSPNAPPPCPPPATPPPPTPPPPPSPKPTSPPKTPPPSIKSTPPQKAPPPSPKAPPLPVPKPSAVFDVLKFGAKGDGASDDTKAFQSAWAAACKVEASTITVPSKFTFLVGPISFAGPNCQPNIVFQAFRFYGSSNVIVKGITIQNSPLCHLKFDNCIGVSVFNMSISSPGDSPNTDGIHLQNSQNVLIRNTNLACGDDCVSIQTGCSNVYIHDVNCGPGHGISIGGLGKDKTKACVSNITVRNINMRNTMTGVRIKTWQGGSGSVQGVLLSNIQVSEVEIPIVIDQYYCDGRKCKNQTSAVALSDITYEKISGTYTVQPAYLACSDSIPCVDVILSDINLSRLQEKYHMDAAFCWKTFGELKAPVEPPIGCIQDGKQSRNWNKKDQYSCQA